jgi:hypothetical protein
VLILIFSCTNSKKENEISLPPTPQYSVTKSSSSLDLLAFKVYNSPAFKEIEFIRVAQLDFVFNNPIVSSKYVTQKVNELASKAEDQISDSDLNNISNAIGFVDHGAFERYIVESNEIFLSFGIFNLSENDRLYFLQKIDQLIFDNNKNSIEKKNQLINLGPCPMQDGPIPCWRCPADYSACIFIASAGYQNLQYRCYKECSKFIKVTRYPVPIIRPTPKFWTCLSSCLAGSYSVYERELGICLKNKKACQACCKD